MDTESIIDIGLPPRTLTELGLSEQQWRTLEHDSIKKRPRFLFRGFKPSSSGYNTLKEILPVGFCDYLENTMVADAFIPAEPPKQPTSMYDAPDLRDMIHEHVRGNPCQSDFSSWTPSYRWATYYAQGKNVAIIDTSKLESHVRVYKLTDLAKSGLFNGVEYTYEYLVYGPIRGDAYTCIHMADMQGIMGEVEKTNAFEDKACMRPELVYNGTAELARRLVITAMGKPMDNPEVVIALTAAMMSQFITKDTNTSKMVEGLTICLSDELTQLNARFRNGDRNTTVLVNPYTNFDGDYWNSEYYQLMSELDELVQSTAIVQALPVHVEHQGLTLRAWRDLEQRSRRALPRFLFLLSSQRAHAVRTPEGIVPNAFADGEALTSIYDIPDLKQLLDEHFHDADTCSESSDDVCSESFDGVSDEDTFSSDGSHFTVWSPSLRRALAHDPILRILDTSRLDGPPRVYKAFDLNAAGIMSEKGNTVSDYLVFGSIRRPAYCEINVSNIDKLGLFNINRFDIYTDPSLGYLGTARAVRDLIVQASTQANYDTAFTMAITIAIMQRFKRVSGKYEQWREALVTALSHEVVIHQSEAASGNSEYFLFNPETPINDGWTREYYLLLDQIQQYTTTGTMPGIPFGWEDSEPDRAEDNNPSDDELEELGVGRDAWQSIVKTSGDALPRFLFCIYSPVSTGTACNDYAMANLNAIVPAELTRGKKPRPIYGIKNLGRHISNDIMDMVTVGRFFSYWTASYMAALETGQGSVVGILDTSKLGLDTRVYKLSTLIASGIKGIETHPSNPYIYMVFGPVLKPAFRTMDLRDIAEFDSIAGIATHHESDAMAMWKRTKERVMMAMGRLIGKPS
ncbi:hypothetical protein F5Y18DRAFT_437731 [Xylariaceae sp. FL1019]|nr:hypothetical protein F5Y18DRAFT_437731 [Xylariaceae sp. FL1019]